MRDVTDERTDGQTGSWRNARRADKMSLHQEGKPWLEVIIGWCLHGVDRSSQFYCLIKGFVTFLSFFEHALYPVELRLYTRL